MGNIGIFLLIIGISLCNVGVGFALAVYFGHGPRRWPRRRLPALPKITIRLPWPRRPRASEEVAPAVEDEFVSMDVALTELQAQMGRMT